MNLPHGVTQLQIDRAYGFADSDGDVSQNVEACFLCGRELVQDDADRRWYLADDAVMGSHYLRTFCDSLDSFLCEEGRCCSIACWNEKVALNEDDSVPAPKLFLVKGGRA